MPSDRVLFPRNFKIHYINLLWPVGNKELNSFSYHPKGRVFGAHVACIVWFLNDLNIKKIFGIIYNLIVKYFISVIFYLIPQKLVITSLYNLISKLKRNAM